MKIDSSILTFPHPGTLDDPLTPVLREAPAGFWHKPSKQKRRHFLRPWLTNSYLMGGSGQCGMATAPDG